MAAYQELASTRYLEAANAAAVATAEAEATTTTEPDGDIEAEAPEVRRTPFWERTASWTSLVAGVAVMCAVGVLAFPYLKSLSHPKRMNPLDMMLRFGGARADQTFEQFIRESEISQQQDFEELYRKSPMYQFEHGGGQQWNFDSSSLFKR